ncbi:MAG TPA: cation transporter, partial [Cellulomonas sp.]|uniref:cation transporter n=1 Tax=Cellulomonas sp. TaxID=40001 RepID=UPI002E2FC358
MTCASCVMHVEKRLNRVPGVTATVNLALETAHVELLADDAGTPADDDTLVAAVRKAGYDARVLSRRSLTATPPGTPPDHAADPADPHATHDATPTGHDAMPGMPDEMGMNPIAHALSGHSMPAGHAMEPDEDTSAPTDQRGTDLRRRLRGAAVLTVPVLALSMIPALQFSGWQWVVAVLALPVSTWAAWPFHKAAARAGRHGASTMDTLVSIGIIAATTWSLWAL